MAPINRHRMRHQGSILAGKRTFNAGVAGFVLMFCLALPAAAEEVTLEIKGGGFAVTGELVKFDKKSFVIRSNALGVMTLDASRFDCSGAACPNGTAAAGSAADPAAPAAVAAAPGGFRIEGSNTIGAKLLPDLIKAYAKSIGADVKVTPGASADQSTLSLIDSGGQSIVEIGLGWKGSVSAFQTLANGSAEIGMASRGITDREAAAIAAAGGKNMRSPDSEHVIALDAITVLVSPENPVQTLSIDDIARVVSGQVRDWAQLGQKAGPIHVYIPDDQQDSYQVFDQIVLKPRKLNVGPNVKQIASNGDAADAIAADPQGIGFTSISAKRNAKALNIQTACGIVEKATPFSVKSEEYLLSRRLYLYTRGKPGHPQARALLDFISSPAGQAVVAENDFTDQSVEEISFQDQSQRIAYALNAPASNFNMPLMRELIGDLTAGKRLSTTIRFLASSYDLDSRGRDDVNRVVAVLRNASLKGKELMLIGFADATGDFAANRLLSQRRALRVLQEISDASGGTIDATVIVTKSFSELAPIDCNTTLSGRDRNRRVEIWVRDHVSAPKLAGHAVDKALFDATDESIAKAAAKPAKAAAPSLDGASAAIAKPAAGGATGVVKKKKKAVAQAVAPAAPAASNATPSLTDLLTGGSSDGQSQ